MAHIIIAEDDSSLLHFLDLALTKAGHTVVTHDNGSDAADTLESLKPEDQPDLILADIVMPGIDGLELTKKAKTLFPEIKVLYITGFSAMIAEDKEKNDNNTNLLSKPFHLKDLVDKVEAMLAE